MTKSQFNIKISKDLLVRVKRRAMMSGKSLTEYITDLISNALSDNEIDQNNFSLDEKFIDTALEIGENSLIRFSGNFKKGNMKINECLKTGKNDSYARAVTGTGRGPRLDRQTFIFNVTKIEKVK